MATNWFNKPQQPKESKMTKPENKFAAAPAPTANISPARAAAIAERIKTGYLDAEGKVRPVRDALHAEFLARGGTFDLPE